VEEEQKLQQLMVIAWQRTARGMQRNRFVSFVGVNYCRSIYTLLLETQNKTLNPKWLFSAAAPNSGPSNGRTRGPQDQSSRHAATVYTQSLKLQPHLCCL